MTSSSWGRSPALHAQHDALVGQASTNAVETQGVSESAAVAAGRDQLA